MIIFKFKNFKINFKLTYILSFLSSFYLIYFGFSQLNRTPSYYFLFTNCIINLLVLYNLSNIKRNYSLKNIVNIFIFIFFGVSPIFQINNDFYIWGTYLKENEIIISNVSIIVIIIIFNFLTRTLDNQNGVNKKLNLSIKEIQYSMSFKGHFFLFFIIAISFYLLFSYYNFSIINFIYRGGDSENGFIGGQISYLFFSYFIRPLIFNLVVFYFFCKKKSIIMFLVIAIIAFIAVFPTGVPRFFAATMFLTFFCIFINYYTKFDISLFLIITVGLIFIFPFFDIFRVLKVNSSLVDYEFNFDLQSGNFDAFGMYTLALNRIPILYGSNLIGALLFFIPRSLWIDKEIGSGALVSEKLNLELDNVSMPFFAEGYLAFGYFGIFLMVFLLCKYVNKVDDFFYNYIVSNKIKNPMILILYLNLLFLLFFMMRGDLLSSFAYLIGITSANILIHLIMKFFKYTNA